jgi:hypothetical protein
MKSTPEDIFRAVHILGAHEQPDTARQPKPGLRATGIVCGDHGIDFSGLERTSGKLGFDPIRKRTNGNEFSIWHAASLTPIETLDFGLWSLDYHFLSRIRSLTHFLI